MAATTLWRLVAGFVTSPALESGLVLHPLYGFCLPGSTVRGLVRQVAEMELVAGQAPLNLLRARRLQSWQSEETRSVRWDCDFLLPGLGRQLTIL